MQKLDITTTQAEAGWQFIVDLTKGPDMYTYRVTLDKQYRDAILPDTEPEEVIRRVFGFLLSREGPQAILSEFDVRDVKTYFPDFEMTINAIT